MIDELAAAAGRDPVAFRLSLLGKKPRAAAVLKLAADKAGWGKPRGAGVGQGIAVHESFGSFVAQVAEVSMRNGKVKVERVVCAVDCGVPVNPDVIRAQMEGGIGFALARSTTARSRSRPAAQCNATSIPIGHCAFTRCRGSKCTSCRAPTSPVA
jgi:isoquinoline 1-oxidoreductase beta subunit